MTVTKDSIQITTLNAAIGLILGISAILAVFYNAQASDKKDIADVSERIAKVETNVGNTEQRLDRIENKLDGILNSLRKNPNY